MTMHEDTNDLRDRPISEVAGDLMRDLSLLVRQEVALAKAELREKAKVALPGIGMIGAAGVVGLCAAGALTASLVLGLATFLDGWLATLLVGVGFGLGAAGLALAGKERVEDAGTPIPEETIENVKEDAQWVKQQATSARR